MVVGVAIFVFALLVAQKLKGAVGDDLVGVHVGRSSRAALNAVHGELIVQLALDDLVASRANGVPDLAGSTPNCMFAMAEAFLTRPSALISSGKLAMLTPEIGKFSTAR